MQTLTTANFLIVFDEGSPNIAARAHRLALQAEGDLSVLSSWFASLGGFGPGNRITWTLDLPDGGQAAGQNFGYLTGGATLIQTKSLAAFPNAALADDMVRSYFLAELAEVLMSQRANAGTGKWNAADSIGEGLSLFCSRERLGPDRYDLTESPLLRINDWLTSTDRLDWVSAPEATDKQYYSHGCSVLFLNFLHTQLGKPIADIIQRGGGNLEVTYQALTGGSGAIAAFRDRLLDVYFPRGATPKLFSNNPFPLRVPTDVWRTVDLDYAISGYPTNPLGPEVAIEVAPTPLCPKKVYVYTPYGTPSSVFFTATAQGFGQPTYDWTINDVPINPAVTQADIPVLVQYDDPASFSERGPFQPTTVHVGCFMDSGPAADRPHSEGRLSIVGFKDTSGLAQTGHFSLRVDVTAREKTTVGDDGESTLKWAPVDLSFLGWDWQYYADKGRCEQSLRKALSRYIGPLVTFRPPLPEPPAGFDGVLHELLSLARAIRRLDRTEPEQGRPIARAVAARFGLTVAQLHALGDAPALAQEP